MVSQDAEVCLPTSITFGETPMKGINSIVRMFVLAQRRAVRSLREELVARAVTIPLTDGCLMEFVREADAIVREGGAREDRTYVERLREQVRVHADFIERWTGSDEQLTVPDAATLQRLVRIAHKYALPRPWKVSVPAVVEYRRLRPSYSQWTDDLEPEAVGHS